MYLKAYVVNCGVSSCHFRKQTVGHKGEIKQNNSI